MGVGCEVNYGNLAEGSGSGKAIVHETLMARGFNRRRLPAIDRRVLHSNPPPTWRGLHLANTERKFYLSSCDLPIEFLNKLASVMYEKITHSPQTQTYSFSLCLQTLNS